MEQSFVNAQMLKIVRNRNMALVFGVGMLVTNIVLGCVLLMKSERIVLVPPEINKTVWVSGKNVSAEYLEEMASFLSLVLLNKAPNSAKHDRDLILKYVSSDFYHKLYHKLIKQERYIGANDLTTRFSIHEIEANENTNKVIVTGQLRSFIAQKEVKKEMASFEMSFRYQGFKYLLNSFERIGKTNEEEN